MTLILICIAAAIHSPIHNHANNNHRTRDARRRTTHAIAMNAGPPKVTTPSGLSYDDTKTGDGPPALAGQTVKVHYTGTLAESGAKFDSSRDRGEPIAFELGAGVVIPGWDEGIQGMRVGGSRTLYIPAKLGYGAQGAGEAIPPNSDLVFETELVGVASGFEAIVAKVPGGLPNLVIASLLALSFVPYFLPEEIRLQLPGY